MHLSALNIHPVKSCRGLAVTSAEVDAHGLVGDRRFMVVSADDGMFLTQRTHPRMALIQTALTRDTLILSSAGFPAIGIPRNPPGGATPRRLAVTVWKNTVQADDCGDEPAAWLSAFLGLPLRLVRMGPDFNRPVKPAKARPGDQVSFADSYPFMVIGEASLQDLNSRLADRLPMNRFRPSFVVAGSKPYAEDNWERIRIGTMVFRNAGPCARCIITTTDQGEGVRAGKEPLRTLATYRRDPAEPGNVNFGTNLIHEIKPGRLQVGDPVTLL